MQIFGPPREEIYRFRNNFRHRGYEYGDLNKDGRVDDTDLTIAQRFVDATSAASSGVYDKYFPKPEGVTGSGYTTLKLMETLSTNPNWFVNTDLPELYTESPDGARLSIAAINNVAQQISEQRKNFGTEKYYTGSIGDMGGIDAATRYMAELLVRSGIGDIADIGEREIKEDGVVTGKQLYNKNSGQPLNSGHDASYIYANSTIAPTDEQYIFGGSFAGKNTSLNISMVNGIPVFYSTPGPSSSDFDVKDIAPFVAIASLAIPGIGQAIGSFVAEMAIGQAAAATLAPATLGAIGSGVLTSVLTGDIKQGVLASAGTLLGAQLGDVIGDAAKGIFDSPAGQKFATSIGSAMTRAAVVGQDVTAAGLSAATGEAFNLISDSIPGFSDVKDPKIKSAVTQAIQAGLNSEGSLSDKISAATLQGAVTLGTSQFESGGKKFVDLTPGQQALVTTTIGSLISGKPLDQELVKRAVSQAQSDFAATLKQSTAAQPEDFGSASTPTPAAQPEDFGTTSEAPRTTPTLDPATGVVGPPDTGPTIRREELISDPNQPTRQLAPGFIPGEVPMSLQKISSADPLADEIQRQSDLIGSGQIAPFVQVASSGQIATDAVEEPDRFKRALQPGHTQVWLQSEIEGLDAIVKRMRDAGISDDIIEETLVNEQAKNPNFAEMLRGNAVKPTELGESSGEKTADVTKTGVTDDQKAGVVSVGTSTTPPETGGSTFFGKGAGESLGFVPFSLVAVDTGTGTTTYDMNNGFSLFLFADGRQKIMDNESKVIIDLTELPPDIQTEVQTRMVAADAAKSAEALQVPAQKPTDTIPVDKTETKPVDVTPPKPVDVTPTKPVDVPQVENKPTEPEKVDTTNIQSRPTDTSTQATSTQPATGATQTETTQTGGVTQPSVTGTTQTGEVTQPGGATQIGGATQTGEATQTGGATEGTTDTAQTSVPGGGVTGTTGTTGTTAVGAGTDTVAGDIVTVTGGGGNDTLAKGTTVATGTDTLVGGAGNDTLRPGGLTQEQVQLIVTNALLANPGLTEGDVKRIVGDAIAKIPGGITATDVTNAVNTAISNLPKSPTSQDITNAVNLATTGFVTQEALNTAISGIKFPSTLSSEDVRGIVSTVMTENPGLGIDEVKAAINVAIGALPESASPADVERTVSTTVGKPSVADNPNTPEDESKPATGVYAVIESAGKKTGEQIASLEGEIAKLTQAQKDAKEAADEQKRLEEEAAKAAEEQGRQRSLLNLGTSILGGAAGAGILGGLGSVAAPTTTALPPLRGLTTGEATKDEFVSPLAAFQKQIGLTQPEQEPKQEEQERAMPYFSYGQPSEVASVLGLQDEEDQMAATGGLITPLMASGGLPVVHYAGKPRMDFRKGAYVQGPGDGQSDDIPAMLADGEYVFDAETVAALGNGSNKAGAKMLDKMREQIRAHKRGGSLKKIPPASKSPLEYLAMVKR